MARGIAHLGVPQVFKEHNVPIDVIAGTSAGAVVASLYAAGCDLHNLERFIQEPNWNKLVNITLPRRGLVSSEPLYQLYGCLPAIRTSPTFAHPLPWSATDIRNGEEVVIKTGKVADAARASPSIPGIFVPVELGERSQSMGRW